MIVVVGYYLAFFYSLSDDQQKCGFSYPAPPSPDYVPGPEEPEQAPPLPDLIPKSVYLEFMPPKDESDSEEDPEDDPADYPADGGDDGNDEDESSDNNEDDDHALSAEETESFETDESAAIPPPHPAYRVTVRMSIRDEPTLHILVSRQRLLDFLHISISVTTSPLSLWSSPPPQIPSPPLLVSSPVPVSPLLLHASLTYHLGYRAAMIRLKKTTLLPAH
ncbi:hypothetical protein Tco_0686572 [Tanacetum coccineum]